MNYLFAAYTIIWIVLFTYVFSLARRQQKLKEEIERVAQTLEARK